MPEKLMIGVYITLVGFYSYLAFLVGALLFQKLIRACFARFLCVIVGGHKRTNISAPADDNFFERLVVLYRTSLLFNFSLASGSTILCFVVLAELSVGIREILVVASIIACVLPYIWGFTKTASIGQHAGIVGMLVGLAWLAMRSSKVDWIDQAPYFCLLNLVGHASGWLGAAAGQGQIRESVVVSFLELEVGRGQEAFVQLRDSIQRGVWTILQSLQPAFNFRKWPETIIVADQEGARNVLDFSQSMEWRQRICPHFRLWRWFGEIDKHTVNEVIDNVTNFLQFLVVRAQISFTYQTDVEPQHIQVLITTFNETSTIVWVDDLCISVASDFHQAVLGDLEGNNTSSSSKTWAVISKWEMVPNIEQYAKCTVAATRQHPLTKRTQHSIQFTQSTVLRKICEQALTTETWFDRFRGKRITFAVVLALQIILGVGINWLYDRIK
jgi:hypothetical protein